MSKGRILPAYASLTNDENPSYRLAGVLADMAAFDVVAVHGMVPTPLAT